MITSNRNIPRNWRNGTVCRNGRGNFQVKEDGCLYSYGLKIGEKDGTLYDYTSATRNFHSMTTSHHVGRARMYAARVVDPMKYEMFELIKRWLAEEFGYYFDKQISDHLLDAVEEDPAITRREAELLVFGDESNGKIIPADLWKKFPKINAFIAAGSPPPEVK